MKKIIFIILAIIILGAVGWYAWSLNKNTETTSENKPANSTTGLLVGKNAIYVGEQLPSVNVTVGLATLEKAGFIVIRESANDKPGAIVGKSAHITSGEHKNIIVPLSRISKDGEKMFAVIYLDDGNGVFEAGKDMPAKAENGELTMMQFTIQNDASAPEEIKL